MERKFKKGPIRFKGKKKGDFIPEYFTNYNVIPDKFIIHGSTVIGDIESPRIVDFFDKYYIVSYISEKNKKVQLGFKEDVLEEVSSKEEFVLPKKWSIGTWVVSCKNNAVGIEDFNEGCIAKIVNTNSILYGLSWWACSKKEEDEGIVKWFATKKEAEEFAATLKEPECEFKAGDWVIVKGAAQGGDGNGILEDNYLTNLYSKDSQPFINISGCLEFESDFIVSYECKFSKRTEGRRIKKSHIIRKATKEEIESVTKTEEELKIGDWVVIDNLKNPVGGSDFSGEIGHEGEITSISDSGFYELKPYCEGKAWKKENLRKIEKQTKTEKKDEVKYKFKVGDTVKIVKSGYGCSPESLGETAEILELGEYSENPGYKISKTIGRTNSISGYYGGMCKESSFELVEDKVKLEKGKWYKRGGLLFCFQGKYETDDTSGAYGFTTTGNWHENIGVDERYIYQYVLATNQEVENALVKEAKRRGFKGGVYYDATNVGYTDQNKQRISGNDFSFSAEINELRLNGWIIFNKGKWAKVVEEEKVEVKPEEYYNQLRTTVHGDTFLGRQTPKSTPKPEYNPSKYTHLKYKIGEKVMFEGNEVEVVSYDISNPSSKHLSQYVVKGDKISNQLNSTNYLFTHNIDHNNSVWATESELSSIENKVNDYIKDVMRYNGKIETVEFNRKKFDFIEPNTEPWPIATNVPVPEFKLNEDTGKIARVGGGIYSLIEEKEETLKTVKATMVKVDPLF